MSHTTEYRIELDGPAWVGKKVNVVGSIGEARRIHGASLRLVNGDTSRVKVSARLRGETEWSPVSLVAA